MSLVSNLVQEYMEWELAQPDTQAKLISEANDLYLQQEDTQKFRVFAHAPQGSEASARPLGGGDTFYYVRYKRMDSAMTAEGGPGIAHSIPHYERRFPSRVATWGPYADYDLLPDADL